MSAAFSADETNHGEHAIQLEDVKSAQSKAPATSLVSISTLLAPDEISSSHALNLNRRIEGCHSSTEQNKIQGVSLREFRGLKKKSPIEMDTINRHRQDDRQVKMHSMLCSCNHRYVREIQWMLMPQGYDDLQ
jgi:hypothetical protein